MAAKTHAERQAEYRLKQSVRSTHFGHLNDLRCHKLLAGDCAELLGDGSPEAAALIAMFTALPYCHRLPRAVSHWHGGHFIVVSMYDDCSAYEIAAAHFAMEEISSLRVIIERDGHRFDGNYTSELGNRFEPDAGDMQTIQHCVYEMREAGLWRTEAPEGSPYRAPRDL